MIVYIDRLLINWLFILIDYSKGFGGKFGIQEDRKDKSAVGYDDHESVPQHESQTGLER